MQESIAEWLPAFEDEGEIKSNYEYYVLYFKSKLEVSSQSCNPSCMYTNLCNVAVQQKMPGCKCLFLPNDLCTGLGYLGRLNALVDSDSEDTMQ